MSNNFMHPVTGICNAEQYSPVQQAGAYNDLVTIYESRHELLQPVRHSVLDWALTDLPVGSTALEVGCGAGASLQLIAQRGFNVEGVDFSSKMTAAAQERSGCSVKCVDFTRHTFEGQYDLVFAQAFIHLFPKQQVQEIIKNLQTLARRRVFFSTTINDRASEGWEHKDGVVRYRSRYTRTELHDLIALVSSGLGWQSDSIELKDPLEKQWLDVILTRDHQAGELSEQNTPLEPMWSNRQKLKIVAPRPRRPWYAPIAASFVSTCQHSFAALLRSPSCRHGSRSLVGQEFRAATESSGAASTVPGRHFRPSQRYDGAREGS
jgi:SAM-dependent methyltransferase